jgi:hypothetical protein
MAMDEYGLSGMDLELLAAGLRADAADAPAWVAALGEKLAAALPTRVALHRGGMLHHGPIDGLAVELGAWRFALRLEYGRPVAARTHVVRGIALKTETLSLDAWIDALTEALAMLAATSDSERAAILRLLE